MLTIRIRILSYKKKNACYRKSSFGYYHINNILLYKKIYFLPRNLLFNVTMLTVLIRTLSCREKRFLQKHISSFTWLHLCRRRKTIRWTCAVTLILSEKFQFFLSKLYQRVECYHVDNIDKNFALLAKMLFSTKSSNVTTLTI